MKTLLEIVPLLWESSSIKMGSMHMIPVSRPWLENNELLEIEKVFKTNWLGMGSFVKDFEDKVKNYLDTPYFISTNTGTDALHLALEVLDLNFTDEVIVPSLTFVATIQAILSAGGKPVFCDVNEDDLNVDIESIKRKITPRTKVILPVHYRGVPANMDELLKIAKEKNIKIVEDAAHAFGSLYNYEGTKKKIGSFGDLTCFSFDPIKVITCGEGGGISLRDESMYQKILRKRVLGINNDTWSRYGHERNWVYDVTDKGYRKHMSNICAAIGLKQLEKVEEFIAHRRKIGQYYNQLLSHTDFAGKIKLLANNFETTALFTYIIRVLDSKRDDLMGFLKKNNIGTGVHYIPNHLHSYFKNIDSSDLQATNRVSEQILTLPLHMGVTMTDVEKIVDLLRRYFF